MHYKSVTTTTRAEKHILLRDVAHDILLYLRDRKLNFSSITDILDV